MLLLMILCVGVTRCMDDSKLLVPFAPPVPEVIANRVIGEMREMFKGTYPQEPFTPWAAKATPALLISSEPEIRAMGAILRRIQQAPGSFIIKQTGDIVTTFVKGIQVQEKDFNPGWFAMTRAVTYAPFWLFGPSGVPEEKRPDA